ncbi:NADPH-dependent FMN reductase [Phenylobacterium aquaticum]|uniref:NADPH-dependent FMN reductase n=1 Tax=Phenylobacterium aquaticum TaxID=1763816 RepID=UPI0026ECA261|nr:NADPH-dependent FMN reductase [Phenylobacterium aquaticum]
MRLLALCGSLRAVSSNGSALVAAAQLAPAGVEVVIYPGLGDLPHFNPDLDTEAPPEPVLALRREIGMSDGLILSTPEYAHGLPGALKNGLDWLVSSLEFADTPTILINTSPASVHAPAQLREILTTMSARLVEAAFVTLNLRGRGLDAAGIAADPDLSAALAGGLERLVAAIAAQPRARW